MCIETVADAAIVGSEERSAMAATSSTIVADQAAVDRSPASST